MNEILKRILSIDASKNCLKFLVSRVQSDNYRGIQISQHNRYNKEHIVIVLQEIYNICGISLMQIRTTDLSKRPYNTKEEEQYAQLTHNIALKIGHLTQDSLRKNIFVDLHRMGLIKRYDKNKQEKLPFAKGMKQYISLDKKGIELLNYKNDIFKQNLLYTQALERLIGNFGEEILNIIIELDTHYMDIYEILFFATFINRTLDNKFYTRSDIVNFIKEYRILSKFSKNTLKECIKEYCNPKKFNTNKISKRDFNNWLNETQQILTILTQMIYFEWDRQKERLSIRIGNNGLFENKEKLKRSYIQKQEYFRQHNIKDKIKGFELHHIVPLCFAKSRSEFHTIDNWQNLVYIDAFSHAKITQNKNANIKLSFKEKHTIFSDYKNNEIKCLYNENIKYSISNQKLMLSHNKKLLKTKL